MQQKANKQTRFRPLCCPAHFTPRKMRRKSFGRRVLSQSSWRSEMSWNGWWSFHRERERDRAEKIQSWKDNGILMHESKWAFVWTKCLGNENLCELVQVRPPAALHRLTAFILLSSACSKEDFGWVNSFHCRRLILECIHSHHGWDTVELKV